ncbi:YihY/virulence factor BrkB family protein [Saxibacter everestensis]|uniref:YihY/virulence factor BrkB family protein n=1 Tax=Saxibacter everestensis TaxID=2909229 RepID=A0ABY8QY70_9MICO|nr:YihY/virulence factor BrkB family protein [Brevibacteriaceae bacterium ZFBP1038]
MSTVRDALASLWSAFTRTAVGRLLLTTVRYVFKYRVSNLAAEAGFFTLLSLPPLVLGLAAVVAWITRSIGAAGQFDLEQNIIDLTQPFLTDEVVNTVVLPTFRDAIVGPGYGVLSLGFLISLWSGSRAVNTYLDTVSIMYGYGGHRSALKQRALSFTLYIAAMLVGAIAVPLVALGPDLIASWLPLPLEFLVALYWPVVTVLSVVMLAVLYHVATPLRRSWWRDLPGAFLALAIWLLASLLMRLILSYSIGGTSIYGPLAAPIVVMLWLYIIALAVLVGAAFNVAVSVEWPRKPE